MIPRRLRLFTAGLVAFLVGMPLSGKAFAGGFSLGGVVGDIIDVSVAASSGAS